MKLINRDNFFSVYCQVFTVVGLFATLVDIVSYREVNFTQFNILTIAVGSLIGVAILSQSHRLYHLSPLKMILLEYFVAAACMMGLTWCTSLWEPVHPHGYIDMLTSFSLPYLGGSLFYLHRLRQEVKKQNQDIQLIRRLHGEKKQ